MKKAIAELELVRSDAVSDQKAMNQPILVKELETARA